MNPASQPDPAWLALPPEEREKTFQAKPVWQRALIVAAGPVTNFIVAILILAAFAAIYGVDRRLSVAGPVSAGSAAASAGMQAGDRITSIGGRSVSTFEEVVDYVVLRPHEQVTLEYQRGSETFRREVKIGELVEKDRFGNTFRRGLLGIAPPPAVVESVSILEAPLIGLRRTVSIIQSTFDVLWQVISGRRSIKELGGPVKIAQVSGQSLAMGPEYFISLLALISINLGFINLLPVPVLDGGHLLFYAVEAVRRRPVEPQVMEWAFRGGLVAILALFVLVTFNDLAGFGLWKNLAGLIG